MRYLTFSILQVAQAHEEGATSVTRENVLGPILAFVIIILAIVIAKHLHKKRKENHHE